MFILFLQAPGRISFDLNYVGFKFFKSLNCAEANFRFDLNYVGFKSNWRKKEMH